jgi:hypothetical protein
VLGNMVKRLFLFLLVCIAWLTVGDATVRGAGPEVVSSWTTDVTASAAKLHAEIEPGGVNTTYRFEYLTQAAYEANLSAGKAGFAGAGLVPPGAEGHAGSSPIAVQEIVSGLRPEATYRYRTIARNGLGTTVGTDRTFITRSSGGASQPLDDRGWELVSPVDKNGGAIEGFGENAGGGVLQAAAAGGAVTYSSASSFGTGGQGAPAASQYISTRSPGGWATENVTAPLFAWGYGDNPDGVPFQIFSADLGRGLLSGLPYPVLAGTEAPAGYRNYYLRDEVGGGFEALIASSDVAGFSGSAQRFELDFAAASPDLNHVVLSTCAALTADATEVADGPAGCDAESPNLYEWSRGSGLRLINRLPGDTVGTPGAEIAAPNGALSDSGSRVFWTSGSGIYLKEGDGSSVQIDDEVAGGGAFQMATPDGSLAFFSKGEHLYRYDVGTQVATDLTPGGEVKGMLGASADGSYVYYLTAAGILLVRGGTTSAVAPAPDMTNVPPSTGTARVSPDGTHLAFPSSLPLAVSSPEITSFDNVDRATGEPDSEVYLYEATADALTCVSCNPTRERPRGPSTIPGAVANGQGEDATRAYRPRVLSADGRRLFFDSGDKLAVKDVNEDRDVYEWEADGSGSCTTVGGCVQLISSGESAGGASFVDASATGADVFFLTDGRLIPIDPGSVDLYDAREGGGFPEPPALSPCEGDSCQPLPPPPDDPTPGSLVPATGNPPVRFSRSPRGKHKQRRRHRRRRHRHHRQQDHPARGRRAR